MARKEVYLKGAPTKVTTRRKGLSVRPTGLRSPVSSQLPSCFLPKPSTKLLADDDPCYTDDVYKASKPDSFTMELWKETLPTFRKILGTSFLQQMKNGSLSPGKFQEYLAIDIAYLDRVRHVLQLGYQRYRQYAQPQQEWVKKLEAIMASNDQTVREFFMVIFPYYQTPTETVKKHLTAATSPHSALTDYDAAMFKIAESYGQPLELYLTVLPCLWTYRVIGGEFEAKIPL